MALRLRGRLLQTAIGAVSAFLALGGCGTSSTPPAMSTNSTTDASSDIPPVEVPFWQTVADTTLSGPQTVAVNEIVPIPVTPTAASAPIADSSGNQYVADTVPIAGINHLIVRKSTDNGTSWNTIVDFNLAPNQNSSARGLAVDSAGNLFVGGNATGADAANHWLFLKVAAVGSAVTILEDFQLQRGLDSFLDGFVKVDDTHFVAVGRGIDSSGAMMRVLRQL